MNFMAEINTVRKLPVVPESLAKTQIFSSRSRNVSRCAHAQRQTDKGDKAVSLSEGHAHGQVNGFLGPHSYSGLNTADYAAT